MRISDCSSDVCSSDLDYPASSERHAIAIAREIVGRLTKPDKARIDHADPEPPHYDPQELYGILPQDIRTAFDMREVIARMVDGSRFHEYQPRYGERSEEHTSELQSLMRISYAVFC